ncbi:MAG: AAA family ATPase [Candidatus Micrarchaeota archaeon]|nr:AAA family ATPase [Candidatus Micrarchaeota archaeon]
MDILSFLKEEKFLMEEMLSEKRFPLKRNVYNKIGRSDITIIYGLRGTGKTTLIAQKYFESDKALAIHGEHLSLAGFTIKDIVPVLKFLLSEGYLFIDEITKLKNWAEELKVLSDMHPKIKIVITGSSAVGLQEARRVLARRAEFINLKPLTFNEFLKLRYQKEIERFDPFSEDPLTAALKTEMSARERIGDIERAVNEYKTMNLPYLIEGSRSTLLDVMERIIYEDIGGTAAFSSSILEKYKPLINLLALSDRTSYETISRDLGVGKGTVIKMIDYLIKANVIKSIYPYSSGKGKVRKEPKYLFTSPVIRQTILEILGEKERIVGLTREDMFAMHIDDLFYLKTGPDYIWRDTIFEIGGPSKGIEQFKEFANKRKYIVYDGFQIINTDPMKLPFYIFLSHFE